MVNSVKHQLTTQQKKTDYRPDIPMAEGTQVINIQVHQTIFILPLPPHLTHPPHPPPPLSSHRHAIMQCHTLVNALRHSGNP